ncbi:MAG: cation:dicarboxylase symporter family transporter [Puniceicoccales bacterium]|jgi:Na+/H+-dicarboxylate symporter|nr:cation:dicarboxylase symporter family transporter [Puniceicoccales bacterium]
MLKKTPIILLILIIAAFSCGSLVPVPLLRAFLGISLTLKSVILFLLPLLICGLLFSTFHRLGGNASRIVAIVLSVLCCSNFFATYLSHFIGKAVYSSMEISLTQISSASELLPLFNCQLPKIIPNALAMVLGILGGIFIPKIMPKHIAKLSGAVDLFVSQLLRGISWIIPPFLFGFLLKIRYDGLVVLLIRQYAPIVVTIIAAMAIYLFLFFFFASGMRFGKALSCLKNMVPPVICAFGSMSSASALPYTIVAVEKNAANKSLAKSTVSLATNVHLMGDCIAIPILIYAILKSYGFPQPPPVLYLVFTLQFVIAKFSVAAVPGGGIMVMLPIIEHCFGFNGAMSSLIFSLYILLDPICTSANVLGNGALAQLIDRIAARPAKTQ